MEKESRIENLLAMLLITSMKGSTVAEKAHVLNVAGFSNIEIADLLETSSAVVKQLLYMKRKSRTTKKAAAKKKSA